MNHIYRSIWNDTTATYVAAAETSKSGGKKATSSTRAVHQGHWPLKALAASLWLAYAAGACALPVGEVVTAGNASVTATPGKMTVVQSSQSAVLNWQSFSIGAGEAVQFVQPSANAVALNRVVGTDPSAILGSLSANGKVFLVNPNGILFGKGASVNVGALVASTLNITDSDFMAGRYKFSGNSSNAVNNQGTINAPGGYVAMLGAHVSNEGVIAARMGSVALAGGQAITLDVAGDGLLNVTVDQGAVNALVNNGGLIQADGGQVLLTAQAAGKLLNTVVNNTGVIQAQTLVNHNGSIKLLGDMQTGTVNAAGTLDASAPAGGNGGFIETSAAHVKLDDAVKVTTASGDGLTGTWLIDPTDYTIAATGGDQTGAFYTNALRSTNVQIQSVSGGSGTAGDINVNDTISWSSNQLKLTAQNNININQPLRGSGTASLALEYGQSAVAAGNAATYNVKAEVDLPSGQNFSTKLGTDGALTAYTVINSLGAAGSTSGTDLQGMGVALTSNYVLGANIDATGTAAWNSGLGFKSIGTVATPFSGQFDGLGHVITGLNSSTTSNAGVAGLFGSNSGSIRNIGLVAPVIGANIAEYGGYTAGYIAALVASNSGSIRNAYASGGTVAVTKGAHVGGLVGFNSGTISDSYNSSKVSAGKFSTGGLVGKTTAASNIVNSYNSGEVVGGFAAGLVSNNLGNITDSFNSGNVTGTIDAGGLTSTNGATGVITSSFNTGAVTGKNQTGGLVGYMSKGGKIINSYSTGAVSGSSNTALGIGGLVGYNSAGIISNSYATGAVTGATAVGGVIGVQLGTDGSITNVYSSGAVALRSGATGNIGGIVGNFTSSSPTTIDGAYYNTTVNPGLLSIGKNSGSGTLTSIFGLTSTQMETASNFTTFGFTTTPGATGNNWVMVNTDGTLNGAGNATGATRPMLASEYNSTIKSSHQLQLMAMNLAGNYRLGMDINAASTGTTGDVWNGSSFVPVGSNTAAPFTGTLDGAGHVVAGLVVNRPTTNDVGLFGATSGSAMVRNIGIEGGSITGQDATGALVGNNLGQVSGSYSTASVTGGSGVGGLVGVNGVGSTLTNSYASGTITATGVIGGLAGSNAGTLTNNYANGTVTGGSSPGGLVGINSGTSAGNFWDTTTSGMATSATGTGLTTAQMKSRSTYSTPGWDLTNTWIIYEGFTTPLLRAFMTPLQVTFATNASKTYDGTNSWTPVATFSNPNAVLQGSLNYGAAGSAVDAGTYAITAGGLYSGQRGYAISANAATLTIGTKALTITGATASNRAYDGTTAATVTGGTLSGLVGLETLGLSGLSAVFGDKNAGTGKTVTVSGAVLADGSNGGLASNYSVASPTGLSADITPKALTVTGATASNRVYDGTTAVTVTGGTLSGLVGSETVGLSGLSAVFGDKNAGTAKTVTVSGAVLADGSNGGLASNYSVASPSGLSANITKATISSVSNIAADSKVYDGNTKATVSVASATFNGIVGGDSLTLSATSATFSDKNVGTAKTVSVSGIALGGTDAGNYTLASTTGSGTGDITPKALTITGMSAVNKVYDGTTKASLSGGAISGTVGAETLGAMGLVAVFSDKNVGVGKTVTSSGTTLVNGTGGGLASNYTISNPSFTANITPKALTVSGVTAASKVYDGTTVATLSGGNLSGLVSGETLVLSGISGVFGDKNVGNGKAVTVTGSTLADGSGLASNYSLSNPTTVTGTITPKALTITGMSAVNKVYDGTTKASLSGGAISGLVGSETLGVTGLTATFDDKNAGTGKTVTGTGSTLVNGGNGGLASNYTISNPSFTANITPKALTVSGVTAASKVYDGTTVATLSGGNLSGLVSGETLVLSGISGVFGDKNVGNGKAVTVTGSTLADGSGLASNYSLSNPTTVTGTITQKALTVTGVTANNKDYDGTTAATVSGGTLSGLVGSETVGLSGLNGVFVDKNAGTAKTVTVSGAALADGSNGGLASNYTVASPTGLSADITPKALTVTGVTANNKDYDGTTAATVSGGTLSGLVGSETVGLSGLSAVFGDKNAGAGKTVTVSGAALADGSNGGLASNYTVASPTGLSADITPKALTVNGVTAATKVYDATTAATLSGGSLSGLVSGETLLLSGISGVFADKNVGNGKAVTVTGSTLADGTGLASNYSVSNPTTVTGTITPKALTIIGMAAVNKVYDGNAVAALTDGTLAGLVGSETLGLSGSTGAFDTASVGIGKAVTVSGSTLSDGSGLASNYSVSNPMGLKADINSAAVSEPSQQPSAGSLVAIESFDFTDHGEAQLAGLDHERDESADADTGTGRGNSIPRGADGLTDLRFTIIGNGVRMPVEISPTNKDGEN